MKREEIQQLHTKTIPELLEMVKEKEMELVNAQMKRHMREEKNHRTAKLLRQALARIKTIITEKQYSQDISK